MNKDWIFPDASSDPDAIHSFEFHCFKTRTNLMPSDLITPVGNVNFFLFTPSKSMSMNCDFTTFNDMTSSFEDFISSKGLSKDAASVIAFQAWDSSETQTEAANVLPIAIKTICAGAEIELQQRDFLHLKRLTLFCTPGSNGRALHVVPLQRFHSVE